MTSFALLHRRARQAVLGRRRLLAACFVGIAVAASLRVVAGPPPATQQVLTAARDLPSGTEIRARDLTMASLPEGVVPDGVLTEADLVGRTTAAPVRSGEPLTDVRVVQRSLLDGYPGLVAAPVRVGDADAVRLLRVGDRIDLLAADPSGTEASLVAADTPVIALPDGEETGSFGGADGSNGALVIVAVSETTARRVAQSAVSSFLSILIRR